VADDLAGLRLEGPDHSDVKITSISTGQTTIVYGNFTRGYFARIAGDVRVRSTNAAKCTTDMIGVRFIVRGGGNLVNTNELRKLVQA
jgi:HK97 family phage major capsid protein